MGHPRRLGSADLQWCGGRCSYFRLLRRYLTYGTEPQVELIYHTFVALRNLPNIHSFLVETHASPKTRICTTNNVIRSRILTVE